MSASPALSQPPQAADEASARQLLTMATGALRARRLAEVDELRLAIQWAVVHGHPHDDRDPMVTPAGEARRRSASTQSPSWPWPARPIPRPPER